MRNMSFSKTVEQVRNQTKTVTRRNVNSWKNLKPGDVLRAIEKGQGLKKGEKVKQIATIRIISVKIENTKELILNTVYPMNEARREGFPGMGKNDFVALIHKACGIKGRLFADVKRIEFEYVEMWHD